MILFGQENAVDHFACLRLPIRVVPITGLLHSTMPAIASAKSDKISEAMRNTLFAERELNVFAVLDGASIPDLLEKLDAHLPEHVCLYRGELDEELAAAAPYLVKLDEFSPFTDWVLQEGWGNHWGIFASSTWELIQARQHFRKFLMVKDPEGKTLYFRYYDPRVLNIYLPTTNAGEREQIFGEIDTFFVEGQEKECSLYKRVGDELKCKTLPVILLESLL